MWSVDMIAQFSRNSLHFLFKFETLTVLVYLCLSSASAAELSYDTLLGGILVQDAAHSCLLIRHRSPITAV